MGQSTDIHDVCSASMIFPSLILMIAHTSNRTEKYRNNNIIALKHILYNYYRYMCMHSNLLCKIYEDIHEFLAECSICGRKPLEFFSHSSFFRAIFQSAYAKFVKSFIILLSRDEGDDISPCYYCGFGF